MMYILVLLVAIAILVWEHWQFMTVKERFYIVNRFDRFLWKIWKMRSAGNIFWEVWHKIWINCYIDSESRPGFK